MRDISYRVALGGIVSALCLVVMFLAGILPALYILLPIMASVLLMLIAAEVSTGWALLTYIAVGLLSLFITADKEAALIFIMFGHYPIIRIYLQKIPLRLLRFICKMAVFNICAVAFFYVTVYLFGLDQMVSDMNDFGKYGSLIVLGFVNVLFILLDIDLDFVYKLYRKRIMPKFRRKK
ncbi:MAG: hypothetical protein KBI35_09435 [Ruminococcus sp.]|nr:hypothetical protein [Ruminococcus sp.]